MVSVLITGIGGTRSIAVLKALNMGDGEYKTIGTDANYFNPGSYQCDESYIIPLAKDPGYLDEIGKIIEKEDVKIIFATVEKEVAFLAKHKKELEDKYGVSVIVPDSEILDICFDKYRTQEFLEKSGFTHIPCIYAGDKAANDAFAQKEGFPLIRKPVFGYGSKGLSIIRDQAQLDAMELDNEYVLQKFIENSDNETYYNLELNEYTAEVFVNNDGSVAGGILLKRSLRNGETVAGYLIKDQETIDYLAKIAIATGIHGPVNFQFRVQDDQIYIFEINPLFSGTTAVRATLGFNSVELAVNSFVEGKHGNIAQDNLQERYFLRYLEEVFIKPEDLEKLHNDKFIQNA